MGTETIRNSNDKYFLNHSRYSGALVSPLWKLESLRLFLKWIFVNIRSNVCFSSFKHQKYKWLHIKVFQFQFEITTQMIIVFLFVSSQKTNNSEELWIEKSLCTRTDTFNVHSRSMWNKTHVNPCYHISVMPFAMEFWQTVYVLGNVMSTNFDAECRWHAYLIPILFGI